ncbi:MAG TPA: flagellar hook-associated protein FlgL [Stenotrophobium sp.]|nr:flagellar hook-associated protein FlgL [Stenotrophobium sp.]
MRISTNSTTDLAVASINQQQTAMAKLQAQISSGQKLQTAADDPAAWAQGMSLDQQIANINTYTANVSTAQQRLGMEENALASSSNVLQSISELAIQANTATQSPQSLQAIASQMQQYYEQLLSYGNAQDGEGRYLFAGSNSTSLPFTQGSSGVNYNGDQNARLLAIGPNRSVADSDNGASLFMTNRSGNGTFELSAAAANTGTAQPATSQVLDPGLWDGGSYSISFSGGNYQVTDSSNNVIGSGAYVPGNGIRFRGIEVSFSGQPADGDSFSVGASQQKDVFKTISDLIGLVRNPPATAAGRAQFQTRMQGLQAELSNGLDQVVNVRGTVGARLAALDDASNSLGSQLVSAKSTLSDVRDVDLAQASTELNQRTVTLQAVQLAYAKVQGLSLFQYLR